MGGVLEVPSCIKGCAVIGIAADNHRAFAQRSTMEDYGTEIADGELSFRSHSAQHQFSVLQVRQFIAVVIHQHPDQVVPEEQCGYDGVCYRLCRPCDGVLAGVKDVSLTVEKGSAVTDDLPYIGAGRQAGGLT